MLADPRLDLGDQGRIQVRPRGQGHKQNHPLIALPALPDHQPLDHLVELLHLTIDLGGTDPHPTGVEGGIGTPIEDHAAMLGEHDVVPMAPDMGKAREIGLVVFPPSRIVPETDRHGGEGSGADQLPLLAHQRVAIVIKHRHRHPQATTLQLTTPDRLGRIAQGEAGDDIGSPGDGRETDISLNLPIDIVEPLGGEGGTRGEQRP